MKITKFNNNDPIRDVRIPQILNELIDFLDIVAEGVVMNGPLMDWAKQYKEKRSK